MTEAYVVTPQSYTFTRYDTGAGRIDEWTIRHADPHTIVYEAWYGPKLSKERLQVDDRTVEYTLWWKNGQKWEEYTYNVPRTKRPITSTTKAAILSLTETNPAPTGPTRQDERHRGEEHAYGR